MEKWKIKTITFGLLLILLNLTFYPNFSTGFQYPKPFTVALTGNPSIEPLEGNSYVINQVCEGLYRYNYSSHEMELIPQLAADMGEYNGNNFTVALLDDVVFHDGTRFNASAVKWSFDRLQYFSSGIYAENGTFIKSNEKFIDYEEYCLNDVPFLNRTVINSEFSITFVLNQGMGLWPKLLALSTSYILLPDPDFKMGQKFTNYLDIDDELIGTGPYQLSRYEEDEYLMFLFFEDYYEKKNDYQIEKIMYKIFIDYDWPYGDTRSLAILNHEIHWGSVSSIYESEFEDDVNLIRYRDRSYASLFICMNIENIPYKVRKASAFAFNYSDFYNQWNVFPIHTPIPDRMDYYNDSIVGIPYCNITIARELILECPELTFNITNANLFSTNTTDEWRNVAESESPLARYSFTSFSPSYLYHDTYYLHLSENMKNLGIRIDYIAHPCSYSCCGVWDPSSFDFSIDGHGADFNDPILFIKPLFHSMGINETYDSYCMDYNFPFHVYNYFSLNDSLLDSWIMDTYNATGADREVIFNRIQERIIQDLVPCFSLYQHITSVSFNRLYVNESTIYDMLNPMGDWYWYNVQYFPPSFLDIYGKYFVWMPLGLVGLTGIIIGIIYLGKYLVKRKKK